MRYLTSILFVVVTCAAIVYCCRPWWYLKNDRWQPDADITATLSRLGDSALLSADVPVAAVVLYDNKIIGTGYNTVNKDMAAGGHAEVNALSAAMSKAGIDSFRKLDRSRLMLVTTWEPCYMCKGAIMEYDIKHVVVLHPKPARYLFKDWKKELQYEWHKQGAAIDTLQEHLFKKHPLYMQEKIKNEL